MGMDGGAPGGPEASGAGGAICVWPVRNSGMRTPLNASVDAA